jgi:hypothetical protein
MKSSVLDDASPPNPPRDYCVARFLHAALQVQKVDLVVNGTTVRDSGVSFMEASGYQKMPAGTYDIEVRAAGTSQVMPASRVMPCCLQRARRPPAPAAWRANGGPRDRAPEVGPPLLQGRGGRADPRRFGVGHRRYRSYCLTIERMFGTLPTCCAGSMV